MLHSQFRRPKLGSWLHPLAGMCSGPSDFAPCVLLSYSSTGLILLLFLGLNELKVVNAFNNIWCLVIILKVLSYMVETASYLPWYPLSPSSVVTELPT